MNLTLRDATIADLDACLARLSSAWLCDPADHRALKAMWSEIISEASGVTCIAVRDTAIVQFIFCVFVSNERADNYHRLSAPLIARRMREEWRAGDRPFYDVDEIARANATGGLNLVISYYGGDLNAGRDILYAVNYEVGRRTCAGWNLRSVTSEAFPRPGHDVASWGAHLGYRIGRYAPSALRSAGIPDEEAPCLWIATRKDAAHSDSVVLASFFGLFTPPRCGFTLREQHALLLALDGHTDEGIARGLRISNSTAKRLFRSIYEKAQDAVPELDLAEVSSKPGIRGAETRRRLLNHVRAHPEELRPYGRVQRCPSNGLIADARDLARSDTKSLAR